MMDAFGKIEFENIDKEKMEEIGSVAVNTVYDVLLQSFTKEQASDIITAFVFFDLWREPIIAAWNKIRSSITTEDTPSD